VEWTVANGLAGLEALSGIPGTVGAARFKTLVHMVLNWPTPLTHFNSFDRDGATSSRFDPTH